MPASLSWLVDDPRSGRENMAIDRALMQAAESGDMEDPFLRIYSWSPPAVSLGFHQSEEDLDLDLLRRRGVDLVRRPTGGAAVLHHQEITYGLAGPLSLEGLGSSIHELYETVARCLVDTLVQLGVPAERGGGGRPQGFACFSATGGHEISVHGRKLLGSALRRGKRSFLQHGSLLTGPAHLDLVEYASVAGGSPEEIARQRRILDRKTIDLSQLREEELDPELFGKSLAQRLSGQLGLRLRRADDYPIQWPEE